MLEAVNHTLFLLINATPASAPWMLYLADFCARRLILAVPLVIVALWLWGSREALASQRILALKTVLALVISMLLSWVIGYLYPHNRPFVEGLGYNFLHHSADNSFPSNHGTAAFTFTFAFMFWHSLRAGLLILIGALAIAWSRIYLGVHWPLDMAGAALTALCGCLIVQLLWRHTGERLLDPVQRLYRYCFAVPIRKGWVRD